MKKLALFLFFVSVVCFGFSKSESDVIPPVPNPPRLVNDFAGVMDAADIQRMERQLVDFNDSTTNVICVVTVNDLGNYSAAQFAYEIGDRWGVRSKDKRNGVVILIKPSTGHGDGDVYISVGYELEGAIPDAIAKRIIERKMIPELKEGRYTTAIDSALAYILPLAAGEINPDVLDDNDNISSVEIVAAVIIFLVIIVIALLFSFGSKSGGGSHNSGSGSGNPVYGPFFGGSWSSGGSSWSGGSFGGGGFGGFGGSGGFGGGGAGGRF